MKKNIILILLMIMLMSVFSQVVAAQVNDIGGHWGRENIQYLLDKGIIKGYSDGTFKPNASITRAEFVTIINKAIDNNKVGNVNFSDVKSGHWHYNEVRKAVGAGYISGFPDNTFRPNETITRQDASIMIRAAFGFDKVHNPTVTFSDHSSIRSDAVCCVNALASKGYISGHNNGEFEPGGSLTRAEAATIAANTIKGETPSAPHKVEITGIEYIGNNQVKITSTGKVNYKAVPLGNDRIYFDFQDTKLAVAGGTLTAKDSSNIDRIRYSQFDNNPMTTRVVFDLTGKFSYSNSSNGNTTILTIEKDSNTPAPDPTPPPNPSVPTVFVDAGHGGSDPGALGSGLREKDITLSVSLKLEKELKRLGYNVIMTRTTDVFYELSERSARANSSNADIFVSIHANAFNSVAKGVETYSYPGSTQGGALSRSIHNEVIKDRTLYTVNRGVKTDNFHVLRETKMPAALIELAFIDNSEDAQILRTRQDDFAKAIARGIHNYFK